MKNILLSTMVALASFTVPVLFATQGNASAGAEKASMCGAFTEYRVLDKGDRVVFDSVVNALKTDKKYFPVGVATQVVAGTNFTFKCVEESLEGFQTCRVCIVKIFQPLPGHGNAELSSIQYVPAEKDDALFLKNATPYVAGLREANNFWCSIKDRISADAAPEIYKKKSVEWENAEKAFFKFGNEQSEKIKISPEIGIYIVDLRRQMHRENTLYVQKVVREHKCFGSKKLESWLTDLIKPTGGAF